MARLKDVSESLLSFYGQWEGTRTILGSSKWGVAYLRPSYINQTDKTLRMNSVIKGD